MGHEIAHALARHGAERMSQAMGAQAIGQVLALGVGKVVCRMAWARPWDCCYPGAALENPKRIESASI